ncbi:MAG TPA: ribosome small subunit-dependent GTPase A [Planctomycetota bacterium]|nr:ribosome small subunit-dependent GTPase A [Planctomycetota bacterium]
MTTEAALRSSAGRATGRVVRADAKVFHVDVDGRVLMAAPRGKLFEELGKRKNPVAVGDLVELDLATEPASIEAVLPRRNYLGRTASAHDRREQVLVANVDRLFVVGSLARPGFSSNRTDRILAACRWHDIPAVVVLNKIDLARPGELEAVRATYEAAGVEVLATCALDGRGVDALRDALVGRTSVFYGASGAGKSSLLNSIQPELAIRVGKISRYWETGKHTTTFSQLHPLDVGGWVIDTPGIRVFRLHELKPGDLRGLFGEFARFASHCRFPDCSHDHEPGCAVFPAVEAGELPATRYASYLEMLDELGAPTEEDPAADPEHDQAP